MEILTSTLNKLPLSVARTKDPLALASDAVEIVECIGAGYYMPP